MAQNKANAQTVQQDITKQPMAFNVATFISVAIFLLVLGITIGKYIQVIGDFQAMQGKIEQLQKEVFEMKLEMAKLNGQLQVEPIKRKK